MANALLTATTYAIYRVLMWVATMHMTMSDTGLHF